MLKDHVASDEEIVRSAETVLRAHGGSAGMVCAQTAEKWRNRGDEAAAELWTRIMRMVHKLELDRAQFVPARNRPVSVSRSLSEKS